MSWLVDRVVCWLWAASYSSPWLGVTYVRAVVGSFDLWMCTSSAELETHSNGRVLGIGQVTVWTSHVDSEYCDLSFCLWLCPG
jgi:hypothetical protein